MSSNTMSAFHNEASIATRTPSPAAQTNDKTLEDFAERNAAAIVIQKACRGYLARKSIRDSKNAPLCSAAECEPAKGIEPPSPGSYVCLEKVPLERECPPADSPGAQDVTTTLVLNDTKPQDETACQLSRVEIGPNAFLVTVSSGGHFERIFNEAIAKLCKSRCRPAIEADYETKEQAAMRIQRAFRQWKAAWKAPKRS